jgi:hypothetical protein
MKFVSDLKEKHFSFPNRDVSRDEKSTEGYTLDVGKAIYHRHIRNRTGVSYTYSTIFDELRKYGRGLQDGEKYKNYLSGANIDSANQAVTAIDGSWTQNRTYERRGWMNVFWDIVSPANKIRNMIQGVFDDVDHDVIADAIDADSGAEEEDRKWKLWATTRTFIRRNLDALKMQAGIPIEEPEFIPESIDELEMYEAAGGFKQAYAMALEKLIRHTDDVSNWPELKRKIIDDMLDLNVCALKADYSDDEKKVRWRYVDPQDLVIQHSKYEDFRDAEYAGEFKDINISELRRNLMKEGMTETEIADIAYQNAGYRGNPNKNEWQDYNTMASNRSWRYDHFKTCVFTFEWIDHDSEKRIRYKNKFGKVRWLPFEEGKKLGNREKVVTTAKKVLYQGNWIVGTDYVYDFGAVYYQPKPTPKKVELTYKAYKGEGKSLTGSLVPIYDNIQIGWLKYQNALSTIFEEGYAVDFRLLQNIADGEKKYSAKEAIKMWKETGVLPYMSTPVGQFYRGGNVMPAHKLPGGMGESLNQAIGRLEVQMRLIEEITGLSPVSLGASPDPNAPVGTTERSLQATHNALKPMIRSIFKVKGQLGRITGVRIQQLLKYDKESRKQYAKVIGDQDVETIIMARDSGAEYGFRLEARPTQQEKMQMLRAAEIAMAPGRNGLPGINYADYTYITERLMAGANLKELRLYLVQARRKTEREQFNQQRQLQQDAAQQQQQLQQATAQKEMAIKNADTESKVVVDNNKHRNAMEELQFKMNLEFVEAMNKELEREYAAGIE